MKKITLVVERESLPLRHYLCTIQGTGTLKTAGNRTCTITLRSSDSK